MVTLLKVNIRPVCLGNSGATQNIDFFLIFVSSKLPFWSLWFGYFCHFSLKLKLFASGSLWFQFYCHFGPKMKTSHICLIKSCNFVILLRGKSGHICLIKNGIYYKKEMIILHLRKMTK
ncbi:hypothetical protein Hanom_Chr12g01070001 [Helianthus anomalus]